MKGSLLFGIFAGVGMIFLVAGCGIWIHTREFTRTAASADGVVVENVWGWSSSRNGSGIYHPRVRFRTTDGSEVDFVSLTGSNPASYRVSEVVQVFYHARNPTEAYINSFGSLWLLPLIFSSLGAIFFSIGVIPFAWSSHVCRRDEWLRVNGRHIQADFSRVELNTSMRINGASPYHIICQWLDPVSNQVQVFHSHNLWFDPARFITARTLDVIVDPDNPKPYLVDTAFLPKVAG